MIIKKIAILNNLSISILVFIPDTIKLVISFILSGPIMENIDPIKDNTTAIII